MIIFLTLVMFYFFFNVVPLTIAGVVGFILICRRLTRSALSQRQNDRKKSNHGILAQTDGFRVHEPLRVAFLHPDLGIGGAERLIVDAAMGLQAIERRPNPLSPNGRLSRSSSFVLQSSTNGSGVEAASSTRTSRATSLNATRNSASTSPHPPASNAATTSPVTSAAPNPTESPPVNAQTLRLHRRFDVQVFTNYHDPKRAFQETVDGTLKPIIVYGNWIPRHIKNKGHVLFAILRMLYAAIVLVVKYQLSAATAFDVIIVDQVAAVMPLLKLLAPSWKIYFYCHFPDQLCDPSRMENLNATIDAKANRNGGTEEKSADKAKKEEEGGKRMSPRPLAVMSPKQFFQRAKHLYRTLFDQVEIISMKAADRVNYNSKFSREVTMGVFPFLKATLDDERDILYPPIDVDKALTEPAKPKPANNSEEDATNPKIDGFSNVREDAFDGFLQSHRILTSINRFEKKKNINLAVEAVAAFARNTRYDGTNFQKNAESTARKNFMNGRDGSAIPISSPLVAGGDEKSHLPLALVICGGYDPRLPENVTHHEELHALCSQTYRDAFVVIDDIVVYNEQIRRAMQRRSERASRSSVGDSACNSPTRSIAKESRTDDVTAEVGKQCSSYEKHLAADEGILSKIPVLFLRSCTSRAKYFLLKHASVVLYTPEREHFGIVPVEAMCFGVPVIAVNNGGPVESIGLGDAYGFLRSSRGAALCEGEGGDGAQGGSDTRLAAAGPFAEALAKALDPDVAEGVSERARDRARSVFGLASFAQKMSVQLEELAAMS